MRRRVWLSTSVGLLWRPAESGFERKGYSTRPVPHFPAQRVGQFVPAAAARRFKLDQGSQMSDPVMPRQPLQPVGGAGHDSVLHATSTNRNEATLTARSGGMIGSQHK